MEKQNGSIITCQTTYAACIMLPDFYEMGLSHETTVDISPDRYMLVILAMHLAFSWL